MSLLSNENVYHEDNRPRNLDYNQYNDTDMGSTYNGYPNALQTGSRISNQANNVKKKVAEKKWVI